MGKGLFKSIYGKTDEGIFSDLYSHKGTNTSTGRMDIRLGSYSFAPGFGQEDDEDEVSSAATTPAATPSSTGKLPTAPGGPVTGTSVFAEEKEGLPMWLIGIFLLGFSLAWRQRKKAIPA